MFMKHLKLFEDWHFGIEFGKRRDDIKEPRKLSKADQDKIDALNKKEEKIYLKLEKDKNAKFKAKKHVMSKIESVSGKEALSLISDAKSAINRGVTSGIIVYV